MPLSSLNFYLSLRVISLYFHNLKGGDPPHATSYVKKVLGEN